MTVTLAELDAEIRALDDDELEHTLVDWGLYAADEHGDLTPAQWATVDALLDELNRRREPVAVDA